MPKTIPRALAIATIVLLGGLLTWSYANGGIVYVLLRSGTPAEEKVAALRAFFDQFGVAAPLAYAGFVILEVVVVPIPGTMLYAPGGVIFGGFWGGLLSLAGNVLGAGIACQLMRALMGERAEKYLTSPALAPYEARITRRGTWVVFLLRVNPLTSSDLVSYAAGLTHLSVWKLMLGTLFGMAPLCFAQAYLAEGLLATFPILVYPLVAVCVLYTLVVLWVLNNLLKSDPKTDVLGCPPDGNRSPVARMLARNNNPERQTSVQPPGLLATTHSPPDPSGREPQEHGRPTGC